MQEAKPSYEKKRGKKMNIYDFMDQDRTPNGRLDMPAPLTITCPVCGFEIPLWTWDEEETMCYICGFKAFKKGAIIQ
jgi:hypothetical protein